MKDHKEKKVTISLYDLEGTPEHAYTVISEAAKGMVNPMVKSAYTYYDESHLTVVGWIPLTDAEKAAAEKRRKAAKIAAKASAEKRKKKSWKDLQKAASKVGIEIDIPEEYR